MTADKARNMPSEEIAASIDKREEPAYTPLLPSCSIQGQENSEQEGYQRYSETLHLWKNPQGEEMLEIAFVTGSKMASRAMHYWEEVAEAEAQWRGCKMLLMVKLWRPKGAYRNILWRLKGVFRILYSFMFWPTRATGDRQQESVEVWDWLILSLFLPVFLLAIWLVLHKDPLQGNPVPSFPFIHFNTLCSLSMCCTAARLSLVRGYCCRWQAFTNRTNFPLPARTRINIIFTTVTG